MSLYHINKRIENLSNMVEVNEETGEVYFMEGVEEKLKKLFKARGKSLEDAALQIKNLRSEANAIKLEEKALKDRRDKIESHADALVRLVKFTLNGEDYKTSKVSCKYGHGKAVAISDMNSVLSWLEDNGHEDYIKYAEPSINKTKLKSLMSPKKVGGVEVAGIEVDGAEIVETETFNIK